MSLLARAQGTPLRRAVVFSFSYHYINNAVSFIVSIILSRFFLLPQDFAVFSIAMVIYLFLQNTSEFSLTKYIIQEKDLDLGKVQAAFAVLLSGNSVIFLGLILGRHFIAGFFEAPEMAQVVLTLAFVSLSVPSSTIGNALLNRESQFRALFGVHIAAVSVGAAVGLATALAGAGAMCLAWLTLAQALVRLGAIVLCKPALVGLVPSFGSWRSVLSFGSPLTVVTIYSVFLARVPELLLGRLASLADAGLYSRAGGLADQVRWALFTGGYNAVLPEISRRHHSGVPMAAPYLRLTAYVTGLIWPACGGLALLALPVTNILFGPNWIAMAPLLAILSLPVMIVSLVNLPGEILTLNGRMTYYMWLEIFQASVGLVLLVVAAHYGAIPAAISRNIHAVVFAALYIRALKPFIGYEYRALFAVFARSLAVTLVTLTPAFLVAVMNFRHGLGDFAAVGLAAIACPPFWLLGCRLVRHPLEDESRRIFALIRSIAFARGGARRQG